MKKKLKNELLDKAIKFGSITKSFKKSTFAMSQNGYTLIEKSWTGKFDQLTHRKVYEYCVWVNCCMDADGYDGKLHQFTDVEQAIEFAERSVGGWPEYGVKAPGYDYDMSVEQIRAYFTIMPTRIAIVEKRSKTDRGKVYHVGTFPCDLISVECRQQLLKLCDWGQVTRDLSKAISQARDLRCGSSVLWVTAQEVLEIGVLREHRYGEEDDSDY